MTYNLQELEDQLASAVIKANNAKSALERAKLLRDMAVDEVHRLNEEVRQASMQALINAGFEVRTGQYEEIR